MDKETSALLVHNGAEPSGVLEATLERLPVRTSRARSLLDAMRLLGQPNASCVVLTTTTLPAGTWVDLLRQTVNTSPPASLIVVSRLDDVGFYLKVIDAGAFDFLTPPSAADYMVHILRHAMNNVLTRTRARSYGA